MPVEIVIQIVIILILALVGVIAKKYDIIEEKAETSLSNIIIYITIPALVLYSVDSDIGLNKLVQGTIIPIICIVLIIGIMAIAFLITKIFKISEENRGTLMILSSMPNSGFLGFPIIYTIFGNEGLTYAILFDIGVTIMFFSFAIMVLESPSQIKRKSIFNPPLVAFLVGFFLKLFNIEIPDIFLNTFSILGNATIPLAMLFMGVNLSKLNPRKNLNHITEYSTIVFIKLCAFPLLTYLILLPLELDRIIESVIILESAMPSMVSTPVLIRKYGGNMNLSTSTIFITTIFSLITIPLVLFYLV